MGIGTAIGAAVGLIGASKQAKASKRAAASADAATAAQLEIANRQMDLAEAQWQHYLDNYGPLETAYLSTLPGFTYDPPTASDPTPSQPPSLPTSRTGYFLDGKEVSLEDATRYYREASMNPDTSPVADLPRTLEQFLASIEQTVTDGGGGAQEPAGEGGRGALRYDPELAKKMLAEQMLERRSTLNADLEEQFGRMAGERERAAFRYGITPDSGREEINRADDLRAKTLAKVFGYTTGDRAVESENQARMASALSLGKGIPASVASMMSGAGSGMSAAAAGYRSMADSYGRGAGQSAALATQSLGNINWGNAGNWFANTFGNPMQFGGGSVFSPYSANSWTSGMVSMNGALPYTDSLGVGVG